MYSALFFVQKTIFATVFFLSASVHPYCSVFSEILPPSSLSSIFMQMDIEGVTVLNANGPDALPHQATI